MTEITPDQENYPYVYKDVFPMDFTIPAYQRRRAASERVVQSIASNFWAPAQGTLIANSRQDGSIVLLDGHGRLNGAVEGGRNDALPTQMFMNMSLHDEILLFQMLNRDRKSISEWDLFHAELQEPGKSQAKNIKGLAKQHGLNVTAVSTPRSLRASPILRSAYTTGVLGRVLDIMNETWRNPDATYPDGVTSQVVFGGLTRFLRDARSPQKEHFNPEDDSALVERLKGKYLSSILDAVKKEARGGAAEQIAFANQVQIIWNKHRAANGPNWFELTTQFYSQQRVSK